MTKIRVVPTRDGKAWDIAVIFDGGYAKREDAEAVAAHFDRLLAQSNGEAYTPPPGSTTVGQFTDRNGKLRRLTIPPGANLTNPPEPKMGHS